MSGNQVGLRFAMPRGGTLEIRSSKPIDEDEIGMDDKLEGVVYNVYWNDVVLPWSTETQIQASVLALGCQWGAQEMANRRAHRISSES